MLLAITFVYAKIHVSTGISPNDPLLLAFIFTLHFAFFNTCFKAKDFHYEKVQQAM